MGGDPLGQDRVGVGVQSNDNSDDNDTETRTPRVKKRTEKEKMADLMELAVQSYREGLFDSIRAEVVQSTTAPSAPTSTSHRRSTRVETESVQC